MKKILILGTGQAQTDVIRYCKDKGHRVYACSYLSGDAAEKYADGFRQINIKDTDAVEAYAKELGADYVYSVGSDLAMPTAARVSERLGLPAFVSSDTAVACNTKTVFRKRLGNGFEGNLRFIEAESVDAAIELDYPLIMKPTDSQGQRGVYRIDSYEDYKKHFDASMSFANNKRIIVEEYVDGDEISVNCFSCGGKTVFSLISDRIVWANYPGGLIHKHVIPSKYGKGESAERIIDLVSRVLDALDIKNGPSYFQIKMKDGKYPKLLEVTPRLDGCHMWRLIRYATGVDLLAMTVDMLTGERSFAGEIKDYPVKPCYLEFLSEEPGKLYDRSKYSTDDAVYLQWYYENGDKVKSSNGYIEKGGFKIVEGEI